MVIYGTLSPCLNLCTHGRWGDNVVIVLAKIGEHITNSDRRSDDWKYVCDSLANPQGTVDGFQSGQKTEDSSVTFSYPRWPAIKAYLQSVVLKKRHSKTKTETRSTQISKTKHLNLENEAPKSRNHCRLNNYNFTSCMLHDAFRIRWRQRMRPHLQRSTKTHPKVF